MTSSHFYCIYEEIAAKKKKKKEGSTTVIQTTDNEYFKADYTFKIIWRQNTWTRKLKAAYKNLYSMPIVIKWIVFILILQKIQIIYTTVFVVLTFIQWEDVKNDMFISQYLQWNKAKI